jgi:hypothetical protein
MPSAGGGAVPSAGGGAMPSVSGWVAGGGCGGGVPPSSGLGPQANIVNARAGTTANANHRVGNIFNFDSSMCFWRSPAAHRVWSVRTFPTGSHML